MPEDDPERASIEIPEWMFDATLCFHMRLSARAQVCCITLAELSSLLKQNTCESNRCAVKDQYRSLTGKGGADEKPGSIPTTGTTKAVSSSPKTAPMEGDAQRGPAKRDWLADADVVRAPPSGSLRGKARGGRR